MNKNLKELISIKIKNGEKHEEIVSEISPKLRRYNVTIEETIEYLRFIPTLEKREKYLTPQYILIVILSITILIKLILGGIIVNQLGTMALPLLFIIPIINIIFTYGIIKYKGEYYKYIGYFAIFSLLKSLKESINGFDVFLIIDILISISLIILGFYLNSKMISKEINYESKSQNKRRNKERIISESLHKKEQKNRDFKPSDHERFIP